MKNLIVRASLFFIVFLIEGCVANPYGAGIAFGVPPLSDKLQSKPSTGNSVPSPTYGPPQIIYRIDNERYFTLEEYTRCENGKTFYNNKAKGIHTQISPSSGFLFKGRLFWLSTRDDYLAFPLTANDNNAACIGSDKGCLKAISVTTDGGGKLRSVTYGSNTQDPNGDTKNYDMLVTNNGFYMIEYAFKERSPTSAYALKWTFNPPSQTSNPAYPGVTGPVYHSELSFEVSKKNQETMLCDRTLEPK